MREIKQYELVSTSESEPHQARNLPYHEIIVIFRNYHKIYPVVYNDIGFDLISDEEFYSMDLKNIKKEFNVQIVVKNGPRFFVMDEISGSATGTPKMIGGYKMNQVALLDIPLMQSLIRKPYTENKVERSTNYTFYAGNKVYELIDNNGTIYIMQSASREIDNLAIEDLDNLGTRLNLPVGWEYRVRVLNENEIYISEEFTYVIQDELRNSYQRITFD